MHALDVSQHTGEPYPCLTRACLTLSMSEHDPMSIPPSHRMDLVSEPGVIVLRRLDGTVVARFSALSATLEYIEKAAEEDRHATEEE